ncbi:DUF4350 domain-containing protein [Sphingobacteriales bacterium UPWRP_1]|nr:hypothetical protein BVG80_16205 [Sphingobacteriales bacterium TSM_CSM]PSJ74864.1 DUF4350 domain-containing protein [Sphingobacteriales bacterium UPWRP_1]
MKKRYALLVSGVLLLVLSALVTTKPAPVDWSFDFTLKGKSPLGCKVLFNLLPGYFSDEAITVAALSPYSFIENNHLLQTQPEGGTKSIYLIITEEFSPDSLDAARLLQFAAAGNTVFVSSAWFGNFFADTLNIETDASLWVRDSIMEIKFSNTLRTDTATYRFRTDFQADRYFEDADLLGYFVLARNNSNKATYLYRNWGKGHLFLSCVPVAFTNYYLLQEPYQCFAENVLSCLPPGHVIWDEYYKPKTGLYGNAAETPLRYLLSVEALKWALYVALFALLLFMLFEAKRKQRAIPVVKPLANTTLEFTKTVGMLYLQNGDHKDLALKKINHFLHFLRTKLFIKNMEMNDTAYHMLAEKTGIEYKEIVRLFNGIQLVQANTIIDEEQLIVLSRNIDRFYRQVNG